jgi:hypothetical protein
MSRLSSPLKRTQRFHKLEYASTLRGHGNIPRRLFRQGLSVHIVADAWTELMSRVIRAAKRDGHSGGSRSVRDHDVDIIMEALCFCSLPKTTLATLPILDIFWILPLHPAHKHSCVCSQLLSAVSTPFQTPPSVSHPHLSDQLSDLPQNWVSLAFPSSELSLEPLHPQTT